MRIMNVLKLKAELGYRSDLKEISDMREILFFKPKESLEKLKNFSYEELKNQVNDIALEVDKKIIVHKCNIVFVDEIFFQKNIVPKKKIFIFFLCIQKE